MNPIRQHRLRVVAKASARKQGPSPCIQHGKSTTWCKATVYDTGSLGCITVNQKLSVVVWSGGHQSESKQWCPPSAFKIDQAHRFGKRTVATAASPTSRLPHVRHQAVPGNKAPHTRKRNSCKADIVFVCGFVSLGSLELEDIHIDLVAFACLLMTNLVVMKGLAMCLR